MPKSFENGAWTSDFAAKQAEQFKPLVKHEIYSQLYVREGLGATDQELEKALGRPGNTLRPGRVTLVKEGLVVDSGKWRFTESKCPAKVWILAIFNEPQVVENE
jgi:hypothetical protein